MIEFTFNIGDHTRQAHEYTNELIDEAYAKKTTPAERVEKAGRLCESHFEQVGAWPDPSVLTRLAWYIVFDEMTDKNEHKVTHEDYPILTEYQLKYRRRREKTLANVYTGLNDEVIGRYADREGLKRKIYDYMTPERDNALVPAKYLDLYDAIENAGLTERQRQSIELLFFEGLTQKVAAEVMGVKHKRIVGKYRDKAIEKLRNYLQKNDVRMVTF